MEGRVCLGGKEVPTNIQISVEPGSNWGPCGRKAEILKLRNLARPLYVQAPLVIMSENQSH